MMIQVDLGGGDYGLGQIVTFLNLTHHPVHDDYGDTVGGTKRVLVRWMSRPNTIGGTDDHDRPMCAYPLSRNHCLWQWATANANRQSFTRRGFMNAVNRQNLWRHVRDRQDRLFAIDSEKRAHYGIITYSSILFHANVSVDPTTGYFLQTIHII